MSKNPNVMSLPEKLEQFVATLTAHNFHGTAATLRSDILAYGDQRARETAEHNAWRDAVLHACAMLEWVPPDDMSPRDVLNRLICIEQEIALDPSVSKAARQLQREAAEQIARQRTANACASYRYAWHDAQVDIACAIHTAPLPGDDHA